MSNIRAIKLDRLASTGKSMITKRQLEATSITKTKVAFSITIGMRRCFTRLLSKKGFIMGIANAQAGKVSGSVGYRSVS